MNNATLARFMPVFTLLIYIAAVTIGVFSGGIWASIGIGGAVILFASTWHLDGRPPHPEKSLIAISLSAIGVIAVLNFQSLQPAASWREWLKLASIFLPLAFLLSPAIAPRLRHPVFFKTVLIASAVGILSFSAELYSGGVLLNLAKGAAPLTEYNRGLSYFVLLAFPFMAGLLYAPSRLTETQKWAFLGLFVMILLIPASLTESRASKLALVLGLLATIAAQFFPAATRRLLAALTVLCIAWPFAAQRFFLDHYDLLNRFPDSWRQRMEIWDYLSYRILERPFLGWGLGVAHTLDFQNPHGAQYIFTRAPVAHPHNVVVQLWVELGLPGLALGLAFALITLRKTSKLEARLVPFAVGAWMAALCLSMVAYNFWTDSTFAAYALTGLAFTLLAHSRAVVSIEV